MDLKENQIVIFKNEKKNSDKQPDYKGMIEVNGEHREVSLWVRESKTTGKKYMSGTHQEPFKPKEKNGWEKAPKDSFKASESDDDSLPF